MTVLRSIGAILAGAVTFEATAGAIILFGLLATRPDPHHPGTAHLIGMLAGFVTASYAAARVVAAIVPTAALPHALALALLMNIATLARPNFDHAPAWYWLCALLCIGIVMPLSAWSIGRGRRES